MFLLGAFIQESKSRTIFYDNENYEEEFKFHILNRSNIKPTIFCKQDSIIVNGGWARSFCIFQLDTNEAKVIANILKTDDWYKEVEVVSGTDEYEYLISRSQKKGCNYNMTFNEYGYRSGNAHTTSSFIFSKDNKFLFFFID